jgi:signal peptidase I
MVTYETSPDKCDFRDPTKVPTDAPADTSETRPSALLTLKNTTESLLIALSLAFVFRAFAVEPFIIPTGSMADTLRGAHFRLTCPTCGDTYRFEYRTAHSDDETSSIPSHPIKISSTNGSSGPLPICPECKTQYPTSFPQWVCNGDRILVLKFIYQFIEPKRWDVVVFKNPTDPAIHYIKRLIGRPGDTVEIIDGDIYIDGQIQRKPDSAQNVLWIPAFDMNYQPDEILPESLAYRHWTNPFIPIEGDRTWRVDGARRQLVFSGSPDKHRIDFDPARLKFLLSSFNAYNGPDTDAYALVSDLKLAFTLTPNGGQSRISVLLSKYDRTYRADFTTEGRCTITDLFNQKELISQSLSPLPAGTSVPASFEIVDHRLAITLGTHHLVYDPAPNEAADWGYDSQTAHKQVPHVQLTAQGAPFQLSQIKLYRDVYYTSQTFGSAQVGRGTQGQPFKLEADEFFVLGDNSPHSLDSRFWESRGKSYTGKNYRPGIVPRDYMVGRAFFVYWPAGFRPHPALRWAFIPNIGEMRFIE